jgi:hypothetical protein
MVDETSEQKRFKDRVALTLLIKHAGVTHSCHSGRVVADWEISRLVAKSNSRSFDCVRLPRTSLRMTAFRSGGSEGR